MYLTLRIIPIPRPFPPPVFDHLQYVITEGKGLGDLVTGGYIR